MAIMLQNVLIWIESSAWKLLSYKQRLKETESVSKKNRKLRKKNMKPNILRQNITTFTSKELKSGQKQSVLLKIMLIKLKGNLIWRIITETIKVQRGSFFKQGKNLHEHLMTYIYYFKKCSKSA